MLDGTQHRMLRCSDDPPKARPRLWVVEKLEAHHDVHCGLIFSSVPWGQETGGSRLPEIHVCVPQVSFGSARDSLKADVTDLWCR